MTFDLNYLRKDYELSIIVQQQAFKTQSLGGGDWDVIEELIEYLLVSKGIDVTVYDLPERINNG